MSKRRLGIFSFYHAEGRAEDYILYLLESLTRLLDNLVIVVNGSLTDESVRKLQRYSGSIFFRENAGFDGEAYRDVILNYLKEGIRNQYDQCILFNNTFCGSFFDWETLFSRMENAQKDFWGLSKWIGGYSRLLGESLPEHLQAFFLVVERNMLHSKDFIDFWTQMDTIETYKEAVRNFEVGFTQYFSNQGFQYLTWLDITGGTDLLKENEVVYMCHAGELIDRYSFPVLKEKACSIFNINQILRIKSYLKYAEKGKQKIIYDFMKEALKENERFPLKKIADFYEKHDRIYLYGNGKWAHKLKLYFEFMDWKEEAAIVSQKMPGEDVLEYKEVSFGEKDGVIVAVGKQYNMLIYESLRRDWTDLDVILLIE